jgi:hypothetical protein
MRFVLSIKRHFFRRFFGENILKIIASVPEWLLEFASAKQRRRSVCVKMACRSGLPDFSWHNVPKWEKIYRNTTKYTKWSKNIPKWSYNKPNIQKIYNTVHFKTLQYLPKLGFLI